MLIREINHYPERGTKSATVELTYDEILDISRALHSTDCKTRTRWFYLFEIVKNGCLDRFAIEKLYEFTHPEEEDKNEE